MPPIARDGIFVEPSHWADLQLISEYGNKRYVWVVEVKAGAPLDERQRPDRLRAFTRRSIGYGALFAAAEQNGRTAMRYIVLGANHVDNLRISDGEILRSGIAVQQRAWDDVACGLRRTAIINDLCETFGELHINPFYMEKLKAISITGGLSGFASAWTVLHGVCAKLGIRQSYRHFEPESGDDGSGSVGIYIKQPPKRKAPSDQHVRLRRITSRNRWCLAWFGYEYLTPTTVWRSVYFSFDDPQKGQWLKRRFRTGEFRHDHGEDYLIVKTAPTRCTNDFDWFVSIFEQALKL